MPSQNPQNQIQNPKIRRIEARPVEINDQKLICLQDPENLSGHVLFVTPEATYLIGLFDGTNTVEECIEEFRREFGHSLSPDEVNDLIAQLDENFLLESETYNVHKQKLTDEFLQSPFRKSSHAGLSYPNDPGELSKDLDNFFRLAEQDPQTSDPNGSTITALIAPHIDFNRGGKSYAIAYNELKHFKDQPGPLTVLILATSHYAQVDNPFILSKKSFETPLGTVRTDDDFIDDITSLVPWNPFEGEIAHLNEHSIEFQVVFLQYFFGDCREIKIVPVLCNSFYKLVQEGISPMDDPRVALFLNALSGRIHEQGSRILTIASADMAHMGQKFGDPEPIDDRTLSWIQEKDRVSLSFTEKIDAEGFYRSIEEEKDLRNICGLPPIYSLLATTQAKFGRLLDYNQALEPDTGSVVTFASLGLYS